MVASSSGAAEDASQEEGDTPATVKKTPVKKVSFDPSVTEAPIASRDFGLEAPLGGRHHGET